MYVHVYEKIRPTQMKQMKTQRNKKNIHVYKKMRPARPTQVLHV